MLWQVNIEWQDGYPDLQKKNGYTLSFNVLVEARDDAFDGGFTDGFIEIDDRWKSNFSKAYQQP